MRHIRRLWGSSWAKSGIPLICVRRLLMSAGLAPVIAHEELLFLIESFVHQPRTVGAFTDLCCRLNLQHLRAVVFALFVARQAWFQACIQRYLWPQQLCRRAPADPLLCDCGFEIFGPSEWINYSILYRRIGRSDELGSNMPLNDPNGSITMGCPQCVRNQCQKLAVGPFWSPGSEF